MEMGSLSRLSGILGREPSGRFTQYRQTTQFGHLRSSSGISCGSGMTWSLLGPSASIRGHLPSVGKANEAVDGVARYADAAAHLRARQLATMERVANVPRGDA